MKDQEIFDRLICEFNSDIVCSAMVATKIQDSSLYICEESTKYLDTQMYKIGTFNAKNIIVDPFLRYDDLRIYDVSGSELNNLSNFGFELIDLI